jgi:hypothetical protein
MQIRNEIGRCGVMLGVRSTGPVPGSSVCSRYGGMATLLGRCEERIREYDARAVPAARERVIVRGHHGELDI